MATADRVELQTSPRAVPKHSSFSNGWILQRIASAEALTPGPTFDAQTRALMVQLWSRTLDEIGPERFDASLQSVLESSRFRPTIAEIRERAGLLKVDPHKAEAAARLRQIIEAMRLHGPALRELLGRIISDRDENGLVLTVPRREPTTPAPMFDARTEAALIELGLGDRVAGLKQISLHPVLKPGAPDDFWQRNQAELESRWLECYVRCAGYVERVEDAPCQD